MDSNLLDSLIGAKIIRFDYDEVRNRLDSVIVEKDGKQWCVYADDIDFLDIIRYA